MFFLICTSQAVSTTLELRYLKGVKSRNGDVLSNFGAHFGAMGINKNVILIHHLVNKSSLSAGRKFPKRQWKFIRSFLKPWAVFCFPMCRLQQQKSARLGFANKAFHVFLGNQVTSRFCQNNLKHGRQWKIVTTVWRWETNVYEKSWGWNLSTGWLKP